MKRKKEKKVEEEEGDLKNNETPSLSSSWAQITTVQPPSTMHIPSHLIKPANSPKDAQTSLAPAHQHWHRALRALPHFPTPNHSYPKKFRARRSAAGRISNLNGDAYFYGCL
jgi:hypothetical protein